MVVSALFGSDCEAAGGADWPRDVDCEEAYATCLDTDDDGGIRADTEDPDTEDMSWVTCYLCKFLVDRLMGDPPDHDVGALRFAGFDDGGRVNERRSVLAHWRGLSESSGDNMAVTSASATFSSPTIATQL
mgnify:CR=1 FL=1